MASIVWVQLFVLSNYNIFTQYLKKYSENTVKVIVFLFRFYSSLRYYQSAMLLVGFSCLDTIGSLVLALGCTVDVSVSARFDRLSVGWGYLKAAGFCTKLSQVLI